ncbi:MATE family efflux transporter [Pendulispora rubella]|uniref:Multidrug-efflux transporter n=1 Tax=Pendulispora rubella TaxID=2741070 RepID=A0ABZ2LDX5_9BACT
MSMVISSLEAPAVPKFVLTREVRALALPAILHSLLHTMVFVVDRIMLGHHSSTSLSAMQIAGTIEWSVWSVFASFEVGTIARVGFHVGAGDTERSRRAAVSSLLTALGMGALLAVLSPLFLSRLSILAPKSSPEVVLAARDYLEVAMGASPVVFVATAGIAILQAGGDTRTPLAIGIFSNLVHIALNRVLILGGFGLPAMGTRGCAISTALTFGLESVLIIAALLQVRSKRRVTLRGPIAGASDYVFEAKDMAHVAVPSLLERILYQTGFMCFVAITTRLGDASMAAYQALMAIESICWLSADGFGVAAASMAAQKLGARRPAEAETSARIAARDAILLLCAYGALFALFRVPILRAFTSDPLVIAIGAGALPVLALAQPFMASTIVTGQALRGAGFTRDVLYISAFGSLVARLACTWLFAITLDLGMIGVIIGSTADWLARSVLLAIVGRKRASTIKVN